MQLHILSLKKNVKLLQWLSGIMRKDWLRPLSSYHGCSRSVLPPNHQLQSSYWSVWKHRYTLHSSSTPTPRIFAKVHIVLYPSHALPMLQLISLHIRHTMHSRTKKTKKSRTFTVFHCVRPPHQITDVVQAAMYLSLVLLTLLALRVERHGKRLLEVSVWQGIEMFTKTFCLMRMK